jgi:glutamate---cysteine ligase / carboxylate-amine ligase
VTTQNRTVGVEEEFLLVDPTSGRVRAAAQQVAPRVGRQAQRELTQEQVETGTAPVLDLGQLAGELRALRQRVARAAEDSGVRLAALATSPLPADPTTTQETRYLTMTAEFGRLGREQLTCGCHVHVAVDSPDEAVAALDRIRPWLACLTAISANSPYWEGQDTGYASWRTQMWQRWPSAGPTELFGSALAYEELAADLVRSGVLLDRKMLYYDARLSDHLPTLEIRVADVCGTVEVTVLVAALVRGLVLTALRELADRTAPEPVRTEMLHAAQWRASRSGVRGELVEVFERRAVPAGTMLDRLIDHIGPALKVTGDAELVRAGIDRILRDGTAADRQRAVYAQDHDLADVVRDAVERTVS